MDGAPGMALPASGSGSIALTGTFGYEPATGRVTLTDFDGQFGPVAIRYGTTVVGWLAGDVTLDFDGSAGPTSG